MPTLRDYGLKFPAEAVATTADEAAAIAASFGPCDVALKVKSNDITHKTDVGGVILGLRGPGEVSEGFARIMKDVRRNAPAAKVDGVTVQEMVPPGIEVIIGLTRDPAFGPCVMFGLGGVLTDLFRDVVFRALPITRDDAIEMIRSVKGGALLQGFRGGVKVNLEMVSDLLCSVGAAGWDLRDRLGSIDLNPVILWEDDYRMVDEKVLLEEAVALDGKAACTSHLGKFFEPASVAVVGATESEGKIGRYVLDSVALHDYRGVVYPVNPNRDEVFGLECWPSIEALPGPVDLTVVTVPLEAVPAIMKQCAEKRCHNMVIVSGGGKELGGNRVDLEREIRTLSRQLGVRIIGCNCIGVFDGRTRLDTFFQTHDRMIRPAAGTVSMVTQSGTVGVAFLEEMATLGVSRFVSMGNRIDVDEADMVEFFAADKHTRAIAVYCEGLEWGRPLVEAAKASPKPVIMYKAGRTRAGAMAAASHTGFYGGSYEVARGVFEQAGMILVDSIEELIAGSKALGYLPAARGNRTALISNGAGTTVQALDLMEHYLLEPATLDKSTVQRLRAQYPPFYQIGTVIDVTGSATVEDYEVGMKALLADPNTDMVMTWLVLQNSPLAESIAKMLVMMARSSAKPILYGAAGGPYTAHIKERVERNGVPTFGTVREWIAAASCLARAARR